MKKSYSFLLLCVFTIISLITPLLSLAQFTTLTNETRVNTTTAGEQWNYWWSVRTIALQPDGSYIIVWLDVAANDGSGRGIYGQRFDETGAKIGPEFRVNTTTGGDQDSPSIGVAPDGSFIVAWEGPGASTDTWAQRFDKDGNKIRTEFLLNTTTSGNQRYPEIVFYPDGSYIASYVNASGGSSVVQKFDAEDRRLGNETEITSGAGSVTIESLTIRPDNTALITWEAGKDIYAQIFNSNLQAIGSPILVNAYIAGDQIYSVGRVDGNGNPIIVWKSKDQDGTGWSVFGRRFNSSLTPLAGEFAITTNNAGDQEEPVIAIHPNGRFIIAWNDNNNRDGGGPSPLMAGPGSSVWFREFNAAGTPVGVETMANQSVTGYQAYPLIDINLSGRFIIVWEGNGTQAGQIDNYGVFSRAYQFTQTGTTLVTATPVTVVASDTITVTMTVTATSNIPNTVPGILNVTGTNGVYATLISGPTPASGTAGLTPITFTWKYRVSAKDNQGQLIIGGNAYSATGQIFPYTQSGAIIVSPSLFISDITAPNLVNDSNDPNSGPKAFTIGCKVINFSLDTLKNVIVNVGNGTNPGIFPGTTRTLAQTNNTYRGTFSLLPASGFTPECSRTISELKPAKRVIGGQIDFNGDGVVNFLDDGTLGNGKVVIDSRVDVNRNGAINTTDDLPKPPGLFDGYREPSIIDGGVDINNDGVVNASDNGVYGGEIKNIYWPVKYDVLDAYNQPTFGACNDFADDLQYKWVCWATAKQLGSDRVYSFNEFATVRCEQSAAANKIKPNPGGLISTSPGQVIGGAVDINNDEMITTADDGTYYGKTVIDGKLDMNGSGTITTADDGTITAANFPVIDGLIDVNGNFVIDGLDRGLIVEPGATFSITFNNATFGTVGNGFDANRDGLWDLDFWYQPVGSPTWAANRFRLIDIQADIVGVGGSNPLNGVTVHYDNEPYLSRLFDDRLNQSGGFNASYTYTFEVINGGGNSRLTPYQQAGSGTNNEKYCGDYPDVGVNIVTIVEYPLAANKLTAVASLNKNTAVIDWKTESEINSDYFVVERSTDNINYSQIVENIAAAGNTSGRSDYRYLDDVTELQRFGRVYYRVKLYSKNGEIMYSNVVTILLAQKGTVSIWPNPFKSSIAISLNWPSASLVKVNLLNAGGVPIRSFEKTLVSGANQLVVNELYQVPSGLYLLEITDTNTGEKSIHKLIKQ